MSEKKQIPYYECATIYGGKILNHKLMLSETGELLRMIRENDVVTVARKQMDADKYNHVFGKKR